jgi:hypothetical protein
VPAVSRPIEHADRLGDAIAELAARLHAATYELLVLLREFDAASGWTHGFLSCAHWLQWRTGIDPGTAREKVRVARALASLPLVSAAMQRGELSYAKVRAITRIATAENEAALVDAARAGTASHIERLVRAWRRIDRMEAARQTERRHLHRELVTWVDDDGMLVIRGRLSPEVGAVVQRALEAAADRLFQESARAPEGDRIIDEVTPAQRRADALGRLAECALAGGLDRGTAGDRYQVMLHVEATANRVCEPGSSVASVDDRSAPGSQTWFAQAAVELDDGAAWVSADTSRRMACDASLVVLHHGPDGSVLDVGRRRRTIPPAIRRALAARDRRCRFPGCTARRCEAHHIRHWVDGGPTCVDNTLLLCRAHHRAVHEGGVRLQRDADGTVTFFRPDGVRLDPAPAAPVWSESDADPLGPTVARMRAAGIAAGPLTRTPICGGERLDVGWAIDVLRIPACDIDGSPLPRRAMRGT